ncbi:enoyl-CoA hydratase/isomerase family protein [Allosalinactinospora lopnorensis]|uniref:enoyl-CoA hydratase/isomerase family protein n=1 Tax=Allosalinactinospora lopnorensis TaxID=1352348 RepID=UPI000623E516|nr:enoyl-CoA hydratase/isomerase family protein [Allosalinactinospora lopnorensis]
MTVALAEHADGVLVASIDRAAKGNALDTPTIDALGELAARLHENPSQTRVLIITGSGHRAFSAGADISTLRGLTADQARRQMTHGQDVFDRIEELPLVTVAALNGVALGGGLELAMACDLRTASRAARLGQPEITLANIPGWGGTQRLPRLIGRGRALQMILTGDPIDAEAALACGLVNAVGDDALAEALALASRITRHAPGAVAAAKDAVRTGELSGIQCGLRREAELVGQRCSSPEQREAVEAFLNRKKSSVRKADPS